VVFKPLGAEAVSVISMRQAQEGKEDVMPRKFSSKRPLTDEEEAEIQGMIASDPDNPRADGRADGRGAAVRGSVSNAGG
jgi:hypothetical protein